MSPAWTAAPSQSISPILIQSDPGEAVAAVALQPATSRVLMEEDASWEASSSQKMRVPATPGLWTKRM